MKKLYKLIILISSLLMIIIKLILIFSSSDISNKGSDVIEVAIKQYESNENVNGYLEYSEDRKESKMEEKLSDIYPYGDYKGLGIGISIVLILMSDIFSYIFFIVLIILFAVSKGKICRIILFVFLFFFLIFSLIFTIMFAGIYENKLDMTNDELYVFDEQLNKKLKEVIDDLSTRQLYNILSIIFQILGIIGCFVVFIFNIIDKE